MRTVILLAALGLLSRVGAARADERPQKQLTVDVDVASAGVTYAHRVGASRVLVGGGGGLGLSPVLGTIAATGNHFDSAAHVNLFEVVSAQLFARVELGPWVRVDVGARGGLFIHGSENYTSGQFAGFFLAPALAWRWLWIGPRVSAAFLTEGSQTTEGPQTTAGALIFDYVTVRFVKSW